MKKLSLLASSSKDSINKQLAAYAADYLKMLQ
jgi:NAD(P)H-dependent FMN reductase